MWSTLLADLDNHKNLSAESAQWAMREILEARASDDEIKGFLLGLKAKGESAEEVSALVDEMYRHSAPITINTRAVDTVGTGGDGQHTINISTTAAIIAAAAGAVVVKHGNRAATSKSGAADLLEALGVAIQLTGEQVAHSVDELGIGFCFAPMFHPAMRHAAPARKELGVPTVFNILGPLANPAKPAAAAIGVANKAMHRLMAQVLADRGVDGFVFRGADGLDEITLATSTDLLVLDNGAITEMSVKPEDFGISRAPISAIVGGDAAENAAITRAIFNGEKGAPRDAVVLNAGVAIAAFRGDTSLSPHERIYAGVRSAVIALDTGAAGQLLERWVRLTQKLTS